MIVKMKKATVIGLKQNSEQILSSLQDLGVVDIIQLKDDYDSETIDKLQSEKNAIVNTLKLLVQAESSDKGKPEGITPEKIITRVAEIQNRLEAIQEARRKRIHQIEMLEPLGEFDPQKVVALRNQGFHLQFFKIHESMYDPASEDFKDYELREIVRSDKKVYFGTIGVKPLESPYYEALNLPELSLSELQRDIESMDTEKEKLLEELESLATLKHALEKAWVQTENEFNYQRAINQEIVQDELFYLQGWIPESKWDELQNLSDETGFILLLEEPGEDEVPPTTHQNKTTGNVGESLIYIYDTPAYRDLDPSSTVFIFFSIFFGMIISDVGYGLMLLGLTYWLVRGSKKGIILFRKLCFTISLSTILFGILSASYFAIKIDPQSAIGKFLYMIAPLWRDSTTKDGLLDSMFISLWVGVINLGWVNFYKAIHDKKYAQLGWIPALIGLIPLFKILFGVQLEGWEKTVKLWPLFGGILFIAAGTAIETKASIGGRISAFGAAVYSVVQLIADMLSFLRIFALAMAGAKMAETFNMLFGMIYDGAGMILGLTIGILVLILGHIINLVLNIMGGVIHGLRLNFIESYHWCLEGGGKRYNPFRKLSL